MRKITINLGLSFSYAALFLIHCLSLSSVALGQDYEFHHEFFSNSNHESNYDSNHEFNHEFNHESYREPSFDELVASSKTAPVPQRVQIGGTCGLYALGMVMDYWHQINPSNPTVLVSDDDLEGRGSQFNFDPTSQERILSYVEASGFTREGEMFDASELAKTAIHFGYRASYYPHATLNDIYRMLDQRHPAIIAFDVNSDGNPGLSQGEHAHYAVLEGYFDYHQTRYIIARHGWGTQTDYVWKASDLFASMKNLKCTDYYPSVADEPSALHLPSCGGQNNLEDISQSLGDKVIEVVPVNMPFAGGVFPYLASR